MSLCTDRKLRMQGLEQRQLMAGDVAAYIQDGTLFIEGDDAGNIIQVEELGTAGQGRVIEGVMISGSNTSINGRNFAGMFSTSGFGNSDQAFDNIIINMNGGNDSVTFLDNGAASSSRLDGYIDVNLGSGSDTFTMEDWDVDNYVAAYAQIPQLSSAYITDTKIGEGLHTYLRNVSIEDVQVGVSNPRSWGTYLTAASDIDITGLSTNYFNASTRDLQNTQFDTNFIDISQLYVVGDAEIRGDIAADHIDIDDSSITGNFNIYSHRAGNTSAARDVIEVNDLGTGGGFSIYTGNDSRGDVVTVSNSSFLRAGVFTGGGDNRITMTDVNVSRDLWMSSENGADTYSLTNLDLGTDLGLYTFGGDDTVTMSNVDAQDQIFADLGTGDDFMLIGDYSSADSLRVIGGGTRSQPGKDSLTLKRSSFGKMDLTGIESLAIDWATRWYSSRR